MRHTILKRKFSAYLDGELSHEEIAMMEVHLAGCHSCQRELEEIREGKYLAACFEKPNWQESERLWQSVQDRRQTKTGDSNVGSMDWKLADFLQKLISPRPAFAIAALATLIFAGWFFNSKQYELGNAYEPQEPARVQQASLFAVDYGLFLDALSEGRQPFEFERRYKSRKTSYRGAGSQTQFQLPSFADMPQNFELQEVHLVTSACCNSVQFSCSQDSKSIVIFQQPKDHPATFGQYRLENIQVNGRSCQIVTAGKWTVLCWEGDDSQFVVMGKVSKSELASMIGSLMEI